jgi:methyltransferase
MADPVQCAEETCYPVRMWTNVIILSLATLQRIVEFVIATRNTRRQVARGGFVIGPNLQPVMILLQAAWLIGLWYLAYRLEVNWPWLFAYIGLEAARGWIVALLGSQWTSRIVVNASEPFEGSRPFSIFREPNYVIIGLEMFILPMVFGLWWWGAIFAALYAALIYWKVIAENKAVKPLTEPPESDATTA